MHMTYSVKRLLITYLLTYLLTYLVTFALDLCSVFGIQSTVQFAEQVRCLCKQLAG